MKYKSLKKLRTILFIPFLFLTLMWSIKTVEYIFNYSFISFGIYPQKISGLKGIIFSPFIHQDFTHLINNSYPIIILGGLLFLFYKKIATEILLWLYFTSGFWLWIIGRNSFHIGASGIIYAIASFLFFSGLIKKNSRFSAVSMLIVFLYGSMVWGIFPLKEALSWEGHLSGFLSGLLISFFYKNEGPKKERYQWEIEEEEKKSININYEIKKN